MAEKKLYQVSFRPDGILDLDQLERSFSSLGDWVRINGYSWYLETTMQSTAIYERVKHNIAANDRAVIIRTDASDFYGQAPQWFWDWLQTKRPPAGLGAFSGISPSRR